MPRRTKPMDGQSVLAELTKARALWQEHRFDEALRSFKDAVRRSPNDVRVLIEAARALGARYQVDRSIELLTRALRLGPRRGEVQYAVGESYLMLGRSDEAEACFRRACRLTAMPASEIELARIEERRHALEEAAGWIERVLHVAPGSPTALLIRARIERRGGEFEKSRATLYQVVAGTATQPKVQAEAYGDLSAILDATGDFDGAWHAILRCKQILIPHEQAALDAAQFVLARCRRMVDALTPLHFERWRSAGDYGEAHRLALLTGFPRSGTTLLEQVLDAHVDIVSSEENEAFSNDVFPRLGEKQALNAPIDEVLDSLTIDQIAAARQLYLSDIQSSLAEPIGSRLLIDKNPAMNLMIPAMKRVFPELKLLVAIRDPRDVVVSCFLRYLPINPVSVCFLTLTRTVERYVLDMTAWLKMREMIGDWFEVRYENIVMDLAGESVRTMEALGVTWDESILQYRTSPRRRSVRSPSYEEVARPIFASSIGRWRNYERYLAPVLDDLAPIIRALNYEV